MSAIHPPRNTQTAYSAPEADEEHQDSQKSSPKIPKPTDNAPLNRKTSAGDLSGKVEIPSLDDMTSYLLSNEVIDKDNFPLLLSQPKQSIGIPEILQANDYESNQALLRRAREKLDLNASLIQQSQNEEIKREIDMLFKIGQNLASNGDYQQAINYYNKIISINEKIGSAWVAKGHCYAMLDQDFKALTTYQEALRIVPSTQKDEQVWYGIGLLYQKFEEWNNAEISFRNALRLEPSAHLKGEVLYNLGLVLKAKGEYPESVKMLTNSIISEAFPPPKMVDILCLSGSLQEKMNDMEGALKTYKYALMINESLKPLLCAGWLCFQLDKVDQALTFMKKAETFAPEDHNIGYIIARCHLKLKQHTTAYDCIHKNLSKEPTNPVYWGSLGILFAELNQLKQAYECFSKALKLDPKCPENFYNLGCLFELSSQPNDALSMYEKSVGLSPNFHLALNRMRKMTQPTAKNGAIEVQFKHAPFTFNITKETKAGKPLFSFTQAGAPIAPSRESSLMADIEHLQAQKLKEAKLKQQQQQHQHQHQHQQGLREANHEALKSREQASVALKPVRLDLLASKLGPQKIPSDLGIRELPTSADDDVDSLKLSRPNISDQSNTKLPSVQTLSSVAGLNNFSFLQNNYNNVNNFLINPVSMLSLKQSLNESEQPGLLLPNRAKTDEISSLKAPTAATGTDLAKQLSGLQSLIAKNNMILQNNITPSFSGDSLKPIKNISSPVIRSNVQLVSTESLKRTDNQIEIKVSQSGFKASNKIIKESNVDEEEPELQKKLKVQQTVGKGGAILPTEN